MSLSPAELTAAESQLRGTFTNFTFESFQPAPVPGMYQVFLNGKVVYYIPGPPEFLIFGQIWDVEGVDLTAAALSQYARDKYQGFETDRALEIGDPDGIEIVEFTNPICGFCRNLDTFLRSRADEGIPIRRRVVFTARDATSQALAVHILCSDDASAEFEAIYSGARPEELISCEDGREVLEAHTAMSDEVGVTGTPTLLADGRPIVGMRPGEIEAFLTTRMAARNQ